MGEGTIIIIRGAKARLFEHAITDTGYGLAGYFEVRLASGTHVRAVGRWDDPMRESTQRLDAPWCVEHDLDRRRVS